MRYICGMGRVPRPMSWRRQRARLNWSVWLGRLGSRIKLQAGMGGRNFIQFQPNGNVEVHRIKCSEETREKLSRRLMFFYIGQERPAASILTEQGRNMADKEKFRKVQEMVELAEALRASLEKDSL